MWLPRCPPLSFPQGVQQLYQSAARGALTLLRNPATANNSHTEGNIPGAQTVTPFRSHTALLSPGQASHQTWAKQWHTCDGLFLIYMYLPHLCPTCICPAPQDCCGSDSLKDFLATSWSMPETRMRNWSLLTVFRKVRMVLRNLFSVFFRAQRTSHVSEKYQGWKLL